MALKPTDLSSSTQRMVCRSSSAPAVLRASSILPITSIPNSSYTCVQQLCGEAHGETYKQCNLCACSVVKVYQGKNPKPAQEFQQQMGQQNATQGLASVDKPHTVLCTLYDGTLCIDGTCRCCTPSQQTC